MKRKHKIYSKPKKPFDRERIDEENRIKSEFGLKNKREIWKAEAKINEIRNKAKKLITADIDEQKSLIEKLKKTGFRVKDLSDILSLDKRDWLERRLQTILFKKKLANSQKHARQLIVHKKVLVDEKIVNRPSFLVPVGLEDKITLKQKGMYRTEGIKQELENV